MLSAFHLMVLVFQAGIALTISLAAGTSIKVPSGIERLRKGLSKKSYSETNVPYEFEEPCYGMDKIEALQERFHRFFDLNKDGRATKKEVTNYLMKYDPTVSKSLVEEFIASRDLNKNGMIDFIPEYILAVSQPEVNSMKAREWFTLEDANNDNIITKDDIEKIGLRMGMSNEEIRDSMSYYALGDENGDGKITWSEYKILQGL